VAFTIDINTIISSGILLVGVMALRGILAIRKDLTVVTTKFKAHESLCKERYDGVHARIRNHETAENAK